MTRALRALTSGAAIGLAGWLLAECVFALAVVSGGYRPNREGTYYGGPLRAYDPARGYRWIGDGVRVARIYRGVLAFDRRIRINNEGFVSRIDYRPSRAPGTIRFAVFGDYFTDASYLPHTWVDTANEIAAREIPQRRVEFYSFATDGAGLANWEHALRSYVFPRFEFDGVIVASFGDDLVRGFTVIDDDASMSHLRQFPSPPELSEEAVRRLTHECPLAPTFGDEEIDFMKGLGERRVTLAPPATRFAMISWRNRAARAKDRALCLYVLTAQQRDAVLGRFLDRLASAGKPVVWATVPGREALQQYLARGSRTPELDFDAALATRHGLVHYDGYAALRAHQAARPRKFVNALWLPADPHWNEKGGDLFAAGLVSVLRERLLTPGGVLRKPAAN